MRKFNNFVIGAIFGAVIFSGTTIFASSSSLPTIASWVKYTFNGQEKSLPLGYSTIIHEGHTYVPARFVAEELGAEVVWNDKSKTVLFEKKEDKEQPGQETDQKVTGVNYQTLPASKLLNGISVEVYDFQKYDGYSKIFLRVKNTNKMPFVLDQESVQLKINSTTVLINKDVNDNLPFKKDKSWYTNIEEDKTQAGYVMLPETPEEDNKQGILTLNVIQNDKDQKATPFTFDIKW